MWEGGKCPQCGNYGVLIELPRDRRHVTWEDHDGRVMDVRQYRCLACAAVDLIRRDWHKKHESEKPQAGRAAAGDGRIFAAQPLDDEEV